MNHRSNVAFAASLAFAACGLLMLPLRASASGPVAALGHSYVFIYAEPGQIYPGEPSDNFFHPEPQYIPVNAPTNIECDAYVTLVGPIVWRFTDNHIRISKVNDPNHWAVDKTFTLPSSWSGPYKRRLTYPTVLHPTYRIPWTFHTPGNYRIECSLDAGGYPGNGTMRPAHEAKPGTRSYYWYALVTVTGKPNKLRAFGAKQVRDSSPRPANTALAAARHIPGRPLVLAPKSGTRANRTAPPSQKAVAVAAKRFSYPPFVPAPKSSVRANPTAHPPAPRLAVIAATATVQDQNCKAPEPALIASVSIKNSGGPLGLHNGAVFLLEAGGGDLRSAGIPLPPMNPGETKVVKIPASTLRPYASLPGKHQLQVIINNVLAGGKYSFKKPGTFRFPVWFPARYCQSTTLRRGRPHLGALRPLRLRRTIPTAPRSPSPLR